MAVEVWRPVRGWEGAYEVSDLGRVRSLDRRDSIGRRIAGRVLAQTPKPNGYLYVDLNRGAARRNARVQRLVAFAFLGDPPEGATDACHEDGDPSDNRAANLRWGTHADNLRDKERHGTDQNRRKTHCPRGHALVEGNLVGHPWRTKGHRICPRVPSCALSKDRAGGELMREYTYREAAARVDRSVRTLWRWRKSGMPMSWDVRDGQRVRVVREDVLLAWWRARMMADPVMRLRMRALALLEEEES